MQVGDLVCYGEDIWGNEPAGPHRVGIIINMFHPFTRDDNILVLWSVGKSWCVNADWIKLVQEASHESR